MVIMGLILAFAMGGCGKSNDDIFLGEWIGVQNPSVEWVKISKTGDGYVWENPDGKFNATLEGNTFNIDFDGFSAYAEYDENKQILSFIVHGNFIDYKKKE